MNAYATLMEYKWPTRYLPSFGITIATFSVIL